ncbi:MAG: Phosphate acyltransferase [Lentisphaerae bacterium ADurb.BinA184]|nr:MAG: Phosphate acyltransferase [Lentisphaerae bacterium ADurb.BinA184]
MVSLAIDVMGGDHAPRAVVEGVSRALDSLAGIDRLLLVGRQPEVEAELRRVGKLGDARLELVHADEVIGMDEPPAAAIRSKRNASIAVAVDLVKQGRALAVVSAGHTGAAVASTVLKLRTLPGIERPGIAAVLPGTDGRCLLLDAGANVDAKPSHLAQYAIMGEIYMREILGVARPRVGLLNVGGEDGKGNELTRESFRILSGLGDGGMEFIGNVEPDDLFSSHVDVVVCDGFSGNVVLKTGEAVAKFIRDRLRLSVGRNPVRLAGAALLRGAFAEFRKISDAEEYGGAPLLGVNGVCIKGHGSSSPLAVRNAIKVAMEAVEHHINDQIVARVRELGVARPERLPPAAIQGEEP